ncbi:MAG: PTS sugar transporter subunit IIA [Phycisphaerae bacterium]|jgi:fructose-specific phosphotransferase system IIA component
MILTQILEPACIIVPLQGKNKEAVIAELVDALASAGSIQDKNVVLQAVLAREQTRSTGIGSGIAIPHGKCKGARELVMAMGISSQGVDFESIDEKPVYIVVLLVSPIDKTGPHIQALARISRLMLDEEFKNKIQHSTSAQELYDLISSKESE